MIEDFQYEGLLAAQIPRVANGNKLLAICGSDEERRHNQKAIEKHDQEIEAIIAEKLTILLKHFAIEDEIDKWKRLSLCLAMRHVPGFSFERTKIRMKAGRKATWSTRRLSKLLRDVEATQTDGISAHKTIKGACSHLARNSVEWKTPDDHLPEKWAKTLLNKIGEAKRAQREAEARSKKMPGNRLLQFSVSRK